MLQYAIYTRSNYWAISAIFATYYSIDFITFPNIVQIESEDVYLCSLRILIRIVYLMYAMQLSSSKLLEQSRTVQMKNL